MKKILILTILFCSIISTTFAQESKEALYLKRDIAITGNKLNKTQKDIADKIYLKIEEKLKRNDLINFEEKLNTITSTLKKDTDKNLFKYIIAKVKLKSYELKTNKTFSSIQIEEKNNNTITNAGNSEIILKPLNIDFKEVKVEKIDNTLKIKNLEQYQKFYEQSISFDKFYVDFMKYHKEIILSLKEKINELEKLELKSNLTDDEKNKLSKLNIEISSLRETHNNLLKLNDYFTKVSATNKEIDAFVQTLH